MWIRWRHSCFSSFTASSGIPPNICTGVCLAPVYRLEVCASPLLLMRHCLRIDVFLCTECRAFNETLLLFFFYNLSWLAPMHCKTQTKSLSHAEGPIITVPKCCHEFLQCSVIATVAMFRTTCIFWLWVEMNDQTVVFFLYCVIMCLRWRFWTDILRKWGSWSK